jgi:hypothetical protein
MVLLLESVPLHHAGMSARLSTTYFPCQPLAPISHTLQSFFFLHFPSSFKQQQLQLKLWQGREAEAHCLFVLPEGEGVWKELGLVTLQPGDIRNGDEQPELRHNKAVPSGKGINNIPPPSVLLWTPTGK